MTGWFVGDVAPADPSGAVVLSVRFRDGAATKWHVHTGVQLLVFTAGDGFVEVSEGVVAVPVGEPVVCPAGVRHRHGALPGHDAEHTTVTFGETEWDLDVGR